MNRWWVAAVGLLSALGCAPVYVKVDHLRDANFSQYRTFKVAAGKQVGSVAATAGRNPIVDRHIRDSLTQALEAKGLQPTNGTPDLVVDYVAGARQQTEIEGGPAYSWAGPYPYGPYGWWGPGWSEWWTRTYTEGTLVIDLFDPKAQQLVWRAYVESEVSRGGASEKSIKTAVNKAFSRFPPS